ncbi:MAG: hypothetical protein JSV69_01750 [Chloroflexota bacterium]|nr:MAG: hypothetical protein JSV69_01750 [Chloroflexota bacterium]
MKKSSNQETSQSRGRNIALGAAFGLLIGGGLDMVLGDTGWGLVIGILIGALIGYWIKFPLPAMQYPPHVIRQIILSVFLFIASFLISQWLLNQKIGQSYQVLIAIIPALPAAWLAYSIASAIAQLDELQRSIQLEAIGIGFGGSVVITLTYALLVQVGVPQVSWMFIPLLMVLLWGLGKLWTMWKYR